MSSNSVLLSNLGGLANLLADTIFEPDQKRVLSLLDEIVLRNASLHGIHDAPSYTIFSFGGGMYNHSTNKGRSNKQTRSLSLHEELHPRMKQYQEEFQQLTQDYARVRQLLVTQVAGVKSEQDIRNHLPDSVVPLTQHKTLMSLERTKPIEETHKHKPGSFGEIQFMKTLEIIDGYVAMRYIL